MSRWRKNTSLNINQILEAVQETPLEKSSLSRAGLFESIENFVKQFESALGNLKFENDDVRVMLLFLQLKSLSANVFNAKLNSQLAKLPDKLLSPQCRCFFEAIKMIRDFKQLLMLKRAVYIDQDKNQHDFLPDAKSLSKGWQVKKEQIPVTQERVLELLKMLNRIRRISRILSSEKIISNEDNRNVMKNLYFGVFNESFQYIVKFIVATVSGADSKADYKVVKSIIQLGADTDDLLTLRCMIRSFENFSASEYYLTEWHEFLSKHLGNMSVKALERFIPKSGDYNVIHTIVTGILRGGNLDDLQRAMPKLRQVVDSLPVKPADQKASAELFLNRCQVLLSQSDNAFLEGVGKYFMRWPLPSRESAHARHLLPRAHALYLNVDLSPAERLLAKEVYVYFQRNQAESMYQVFISPESRDEIPEQFVDASHLLTALKSLDLTESPKGKKLSDEKFDQQRQKVMPALRFLNQLQTGYLDHFRTAMNQSKYETVNTENFKFFIIPVFWEGMDLSINYGYRLHRCVLDHSTGRAGTDLYLANQDPYSLKSARNLRLIEMLFNKLENGEKCTEREVAVFKKAMIDDKYDNEFLEGDTPASIDPKQLYCEMLSSTTIRDFLRSPIYKMVGVKDLEKKVEKNARAITHLLIRLALSTLKNRYTLQTTMGDDAYPCIDQAYAFLLKPVIFSLLDGDQKFTLLSAISNDMSNLLFYYREAREENSAGSDRYFLTNDVADIITKEEFHGLVSIADWIERFSARISKFDRIIDLAQQVEAYACQSDIHWSWKGNDNKAEMIEVMKEFRDELSKKHEVLVKMSRFYDMHVKSLLEYINGVIAALPKTSYLLTGIQQAKAGLLDKDLFIRKHCQLFLRQRGNVDVPREFINALLDEENSQSLGVSLNQAVGLLGRKSSSTTNFFSFSSTKKTAFEPLDTFLDNQYGKVPERTVSTDPFANVVFSFNNTSTDSVASPLPAQVSGSENPFENINFAALFSPVTTKEMIVAQPADSDRDDISQTHNSSDSPPDQEGEPPKQDQDPFANVIFRF